MVTIKVYVEGGTIDQNASDADINNSAALRQSLSELFNRFGQQTFKIECEMCGSYTKAVKQFKESIDITALLLMDLDDLPSNRAEKIRQLQLEGEQNRVFFMIQEMEAWFISQTDLIAVSLKERGYETKLENDLSEDESIKNVEISTIKKPSILWTRLIPNYFFEVKNGIEKPLKYGKLKNAPMFIRFLDINRLRNDFIDVENLLNLH
ncbi:MAG: hypothetical protein RL757_2211 [Bacteroidota bacterium]|jgi:hypothetical protein